MKQHAQTELRLDMACFGGDAEEALCIGVGQTRCMDFTGFGWIEA
jgi:hypothetical protein